MRPVIGRCRRRFFFCTAAQLHAPHAEEARAPAHVLPDAANLPPQSLIETAPMIIGYLAKLVMPGKKREDALRALARP